MTDKIVKERIEFENSYEAMAAYGQYDANLKKLEKENKVKIFARGNTAAVEGRKKDVEKTIQQLEELKRGHRKAEMRKTEGELLRTPSGKPVKPLSEKQKEYIKAMESNDLVVAIGPAGTGKTFLACVEAYRNLKQGEVDRIVLTRPVVEAGEKLGFLPGALQEKIDPYLRPLYDAFYTLMGPAKFHKLAQDGVIEIVPLAYMRGRTLDDAVIVLDEAQNTSSAQMKMFLTRIGFNSKAVVTGDITQIDLEHGAVSGLVEIQEILHGIKGVNFIYFSEADVVRHQLVKKIIDAYTKFKESRTDKE